MASSNVVQIKPYASVPEGLRNIADSIESGDYPSDGCTMIIGTEVFHLGCMDDGQAASEAIFNMTFGIQKLMRPVVDACGES